MARVSLYLKTARLNADGEAPLYLRVSHGAAKERLVGLALRIRPRDWNARRQQVRPSAPGASRLNEALARARARAQAVLADAAAAAGGALTSVSVDELRDRLEAEFRPVADAPPAPSPARPDEDPRTCLLAYGALATDRYEREGRVATARAYRTALAKARQYLAATAPRGARDRLPFDAVTPALVEGLRAFCAAAPPHGLGNAPNTVHKAVTSLARLWRLAERDGLLDDASGRPPADPFRRVPVRRAPTRREKLSADEVRAVEAVPLDDPATARTRDLWTFALYAGGMRFSDVATLERRHVRRDPDGTWRVAYRMRKTDRVHAVPLAAPAAAVLAAAWTERALADAPPETLVFPLLDGYDRAAPRALHAAIASQNTLANRRLKAVQAAAEALLGRPLSAPLTFHLARHSLAGRLLEQGWDVYDIRQVLGHANVRVTEEYLRGFGRPDLDDKLRKLF